MQNKNVKILIVDDMQDNRDILKVILNNMNNIDVFEAENGKVAIEMVKKVEPDIIVMDVMMPELDGFEATKIIKKDYPEIIVMVVTAVEDFEMEKKMTEVGATCYTIKPINGALFKYKISNFINLINLKKNYKSVLMKQDSINPFSNEIRNLKTFYTIENEDDMMDFGTWLLDFYHRFKQTTSMMFQKKLEFLYRVMTNNLKKEEILTITIEDGFDELYINFEIPKSFSIDKFDTGILDNIGEDLVIKDNYIHLKIAPNKNLPTGSRKDEIEERVEPNEKVEENKDSEKKEKEIIKIDNHDRTLLRQSHIDKVHAKEFVAQIEGAIIDEIHDLIDLEEHWDENLDKYELKPAKEILIDISTILSKYSSVVNSLYSFMALSYALSSLSTFIRDIDIEVLDEKTTKKLILLLRSVKSDLSDWRINIFEDQSTTDIHYLDSSLLSSCMQIEALFSNKEIEDEEENDLELF